MSCREAQATGIWAYDCVLHDIVLVIIWVLAMLGDNPMQSKFACHAGLQAKFFCCMCWVKGHDSADNRDNSEGNTLEESSRKETLKTMIAHLLSMLLNLTKLSRMCAVRSSRVEHLLASVTP